MPYQRRDFIKTAATGIALTAITGNLLGCKSSAVLSNTGTIKDFGIQLYTVRDLMAKDPRGTLKKIADMGYKQIESFNHGKLGMFWGMSNVEFKKYLDQIGLTLVSSHYKPDKDFDRKTAEAAAIGMKYIIYPYEGTPFRKNDADYATLPKTIDDFKRWADEFNKYGEICRKNGIRYAYHNHDYTFSSLENQIPQSILLNNTDKTLVDFEMDIYWVITAGQDPIEWLKKYPGRFKLVHVKDRKKDAQPSERETFSILGKGSINFAPILKTALQTGVKYFLVEQDQTYDIPVLEAVKENADYLKTLKI
ncbi:MAG: sugar phosphate isomerase/epimerase [Ferruginibacter sp.]